MKRKGKPKSSPARLAKQKAINKRPAEKKKRALHIKIRRKMGIYGKGGPDVSTHKDGTVSKESKKTNRARRGKKSGTGSKAPKLRSKRGRPKGAKNKK